MLRSMPREHIDTRRARVAGEGNVMWVVADYKRARQIQSVFPGGSFQKERPWLDAGALLLAPVRAAVDRGNENALPAQFGDDMVVDPRHFRGTQHSG